MWFKIIDEIIATEEEREAIYDGLKNHGFTITEAEIYDEEENDTFTWKYIDINSLEDLMKLNNVLGYPVAIEGPEIVFLETT